MFKDPSLFRLIATEDSLVNLCEYFYDTDPNNNDTDNDNLLDGEEIFIYNCNPTSDDTDNDNLKDYEELFTKGPQGC